jgi:cytochrome c553
MNRGSIARCRALIAGLLALASATVSAAGFIDLRRMKAVTGDAGAGKPKAAACIGCHGPAGIAPVPMFPNLAAQKADYLYWSLVEFQRSARPDSPMTAQVAKLSDADLLDLAAYFSALPGAAAAVDVPPAARLDSRGAALFHAGDPIRGIPPCQGCHGVDANGHAASAVDVRYRAYPALRGQHANYVVQRLQDFRAGKRVDSSNDMIMRGVARTLDDDSMQAIATWLQSQ